jgi:hypothetical protein
MPSTPVTISNDLVLPVTLSFTIHDAMAPPPAVLPPFIPHFELPVTMMWPPGFGLQQNKLTTTVLHKMMPFALDGHDCGYLIVHIPVPVAPPNLKLPLHIAFSSRKIAFSASTVKANGTPVACTAIFIPFPMMCCANPVTLPIGTAPLNMLNTVLVGMTWLDVLMGVVSIAATMILDYIFWDRTKPPGMPSAADMLWKMTLGDSPKAWAVKTAVGLATNGVRLLAGGDGSLQLSFGPGGYWGANVGFSRSDGVWSFGASGSAGVPVLGPFGPATGSVGGTYQHTWNADGTTTDTTTTTVAGGQSLGPGGVAGSHTSSSSTITDASGREVSTTESSTDQVVGGEPFVGGSRVETSTTTTPAGGPSTTETGGAQGGDAFGNVWGESL